MPEGVDVSRQSNSAAETTFDPIWEYTLKDHLGNSRVMFRVDPAKSTVDASDIIQENSYYPFGMNQVNPNAFALVGDENGYQYNGKELNGDFGLDWNDYGARWQDPSTGRFTTIDRFSEKYFSLTSYQYAGNNPISKFDVNGDSIIVLSAPSGAMGAGHAAVLIGNDGEGWNLFSKNGTTGSSGKKGPSDDHPQNRVPYDNLQEFLDDPANQGEEGAYYTEGYLIESDTETDLVMEAAAYETVESDYVLLASSCIDVCTKALETGGFNGGQRDEKEFKGGRSNSNESHSFRPIPNSRYDAIKRNNEGTVIDLLQYQEKQ